MLFNFIGKLIMNYSLKTLSIMLISSCAFACPTEEGEHGKVRTDKSVMEMRKKMSEQKGFVKVSQLEEQASPSGEVPEDMLVKVKQDLNKRLGHDNFELVSSKSVRWPDGAMGCSKPGMMYPQVIIDGYHVVYRADNKLWDYRMNARGGFRLCKNPSPTAKSYPAK